MSTNPQRFQGFRAVVLTTELLIAESVRKYHVASVVYFFHVCVKPACMFVYLVCAWCIKCLEEGMGFVYVG